MSYQQDGRAIAGNQAVEVGAKAARVALVPRSLRNYGVSGTTGIMAAVLAANSAIFAMRMNASADRRAFVERVRIQYTTLTAFTTPVTAGRRIGLYRGSGVNNPSTGTQLAALKKSTSLAPASWAENAGGGDIRVATTAAITVTGATYEAVPFAEASLVHVGASGGFAEYIFDFEHAPIILGPGQIFAVRNPVAMDAAGTFQLVVRVDWHEAFLLDDSSSE